MAEFLTANSAAFCRLTSPPEPTAIWSAACSAALDTVRLLEQFSIVESASFRVERK